MVVEEGLGEEGRGLGMVKEAQAGTRLTNVFTAGCFQARGGEDVRSFIPPKHEFEHDYMDITNACGVHSMLHGSHAAKARTKQASQRHMGATRQQETGTPKRQENHTMFCKEKVREGGESGSCSRLATDGMTVKLGNNLSTHKEDGSDIPSEFWAQQRHAALAGT